MQSYHAIRRLKSATESKLQSGDHLVLFGELFAKGYATGLVQEAQSRGMKVIYSTVGRREKDGTLRPLNSEELSAQPKPLINVPLEAGMDLEADSNGLTLVDSLKDVKLSDWENYQLNANSLREWQNKGRLRFTKYVRQYLAELEKQITPGKNVIIAHLMAGGVPRAKAVLPLMNRVVKGIGDRYLSSEKFSKSGIGQLMLACFHEVTAETFNILLTESANLRQKIESQGGKVSYTAYGYHGTEVLIGSEFKWQSYSPYLQGWAKLALENYSRDFSKKGLATCVYNCPEILTNSSNIFSGVELSLYPLLTALQKEGSAQPHVSQFVSRMQAALKDGVATADIKKFTDDYLSSPLIREHCIFEKWPQHSSKDQLEKMLHAADHLVEQHRDSKVLMTFSLSEVVFSACGQVMLSDALQPESAVSWINHDVIAKIYASHTH